MRTPMKQCPECHAPNPPRLSRCHYCGADLAAPRRGVALPGQAVLPCVNCQGDIPVGAEACPHCGRLVGVPGTALPSPAGAGPPGWDARSLPDGTTVLQRRGWSHGGASLTQPVGVGFLIYYVVATVLRVIVFAQGSAAGVLFLLSIPLILLAIALGIWLICGRYEIRVGFNHLEERRVLLRWCKVRRFSDGILVLRWDSDPWSRRHGYGDPIRWKLEVRGHGGAATLASGSDRSYIGLLREWSSRGDIPAPSPELIYLGEWLAEQTGWSLDRPLGARPGGWS